MKKGKFTLRRITEQWLFFALTLIYMALILYVCFSACLDGEKWYKILWIPIVALIPGGLVCTYYALWRLEVNDTRLRYRCLGGKNLIFTLAEIQSATYYSRVRGSGIEIMLRNGTRLFIPESCRHFKQFLHYIRSRRSMEYH